MLPRLQFAGTALRVRITEGITPRRERGPPWPGQTWGGATRAVCAVRGDKPHQRKSAWREHALFETFNSSKLESVYLDTKAPYCPSVAKMSQVWFDLLRNVANLFPLGNGP